MDNKTTTKKHFNRRIKEAIIFLLIIIVVFGLLGSRMGMANMMNTIMRTAHDLLLNTVFYLMGITVLTGALSKLLAEFGVINLLEKLLRPLMKPLYNLPGVAALGGVMTFLSDNPAIIALSKDKNFSSYFKKYQLVSLTNFGTAFGMGFVVIISMIGYGQNYLSGALVGLCGAVVGSIISTRLMQRFTLKAFPEMNAPVMTQKEIAQEEQFEEEKEQKESIFIRTLNAMLDGGKTGVELGLAIIPGVVIITTMVLLITNSAPMDGYNGGIGQGVPILPWLADKIHWVFEWLFGFNHMEFIAFPMTALGSVGAALGLVSSFAKEGILDGNAVAVCTAIGMCWSGYLSTHAAMLDSLGYRKLISKAILAHTIGGLFAGIFAHFLYLLISLI
ncbi:MAG: nucleoside recognition domain-containing protein [Bacteroidota bacterium]|nr:nucleoside recognition domain-containing protein [Bacteroidota bacterium]